tara:strand:+ start:462 stop:1397 length:936 start_codon:yes stop_codon:yes gene_type:complete
MNKFHNAASLLNSKAPKGEFLAYINENEANILKNLGGLGLDINGTGVPSFIDYGDVESGLAGGEFGGGSPKDTFGGGDNNFSNGDDIDSTYTTGTEFNVTPTYEPTFTDRVSDYIQSGGFIGQGIRTISDIFGTPENQYAGITGEDGYGEGDYVSTVGDWAESRGLTTDYSSEDLETQQQLDKQAFDAGFRTQSFKDLYETGDVSNLENLSQSESDEVRRLIPQAPFIQSGQQPVDSMVNKYFANMGNQFGLSSQLESDYNTAKANVANTLSITPLAQQFGYSTQPYGGLTATNLSTNPFNIEYLETRGLI